MKIAPFHYTIRTPPGYVCARCGASGCKLWRLYQTLVDCQELTCLACTEKDQNKSPDRTADNAAIGWRVAAVPTEDGESFWGYTSIPEAGVAWWKALP